MVKLFRNDSGDVTVLFFHSEVEFCLVAIKGFNLISVFQLVSSKS